MATIESDGYDVNGFMAARTFRASLRSARDTTASACSTSTATSITSRACAVVYAMPGLWPVGTGTTRLVAGDFNQGILGIRSGHQFPDVPEGVITDNTGAIVFNLMQQDMQAMRVTFRVGFEVANPINYDQPTEASRYPFGVLRTP
jgi:hypothetical protein